MSPPALSRRALTPAGAAGAARLARIARAARLAAAIELAAPPPAVRLGRADAIENLRQSQIHLPPLHVDLDDLHPHAIAEPVDATRVLALEDVRPLPEPVVVVGHRRDVDEPLDEVLDQLDEEPERGHAGDVAVDLVADLVRHEADLLPLHQLALCLVGAPLAIRRMTRHFREIL